MRRIFFVILALFFICGFLSFSFAQNPPQEEQSQLKEPAGAGVSETPGLIKAIEVKGNKSISTNTIVSKMKSRMGSPYQENVVSDDLKRLYLLGFFSDIKIDTEDYKGGVKLIVSVAERPIISKINFSGIVRIALKDEKLKEQLKSKEGQYLDYPVLSEDVRTLQKMYEKMGYSNADIKYNINISEETNRANVEFRVTEGKKVKIKNIYIRGNKAYPARRILKLMKTKKAWFFNAGVLKDEVLKEDIERLKSFYRREGFSDAAVTYEVAPGKNKPYLLYITITIEEGKKYLVGSVTIQGNKEIKEKEILSRLKACLPGKVFSQEALKQDAGEIQGLYFDRGYISALVNESTSLSPSSGRVDIVYNVVENEITYVNKIKIRGNVKTRDVVIRRELRVNPGDKFDGDKLRRSKERLQNLGFFEDISYDTEPTAQTDKKDLVVEVKETKTGAFSFGGGYSTVDGFIGFIEIEQKNFDWKNFPYFTGDGQNLTFRAQLGTLINNFDLSFTEPWLFDYPVTFGFDAYRRQHKRDESVGYGYDEKVTGGALRLGKTFTEYLRGDITYRIEQIYITNITDNATDDLTREYGKNNVSSFTFSSSFDSRDNIFDTRKGDLFSGSVQIAGGPLGGSKDFWKFSGRASRYFPLPRSSALEFRARLGVGNGYKGSEIPIYERFFAGGASTIRGYDERKVGPIDPASKDPLGGDSMVVGNIEYTYPLYSFIKLAAFVDTGNVWNKATKIFSSGFKSGFGIGARLKTPVGPIMLDYGIPLNKAPGEEKKTGGKFYFSASHGF